MRSNLSVGGYSYASRCNSFDVREFPLHSSGSNRVAGFEVCFAHSMPPRIDDALVQRGEEADGAIPEGQRYGTPARLFTVWFAPGVVVCRTGGHTPWHSVVRRVPGQVRPPRVVQRLRTRARGGHHQADPRERKTSTSRQSSLPASVRCHRRRAVAVAEFRSPPRDVRSSAGPCPDGTRRGSAHRFSDADPLTGARRGHAVAGGRVTDRSGSVCRYGSIWTMLS